MIEKTSKIFHSNLKKEHEFLFKIQVELYDIYVLQTERQSNFTGDRGILLALSLLYE